MGKAGSKRGDSGWCGDGVAAWTAPDAALLPAPAVETPVTRFHSAAPPFRGLQPMPAGSPSALQRAPQGALRDAGAAPPGTRHPDAGALPRRYYPPIPGQTAGVGGAVGDLIPLAFKANPTRLDASRPDRSDVKRPNPRVKIPPHVSLSTAMGVEAQPQPHAQGAVDVKIPPHLTAFERDIAQMTEPVLPPAHADLGHAVQSDPRPAKLAPDVPRARATAFSAPDPALLPLSHASAGGGGSLAPSGVGATRGPPAARGADSAFPFYPPPAPPLDSFGGGPASPAAWAPSAGHSFCDPAGAAAGKRKAAFPDYWGGPRSPTKGGAADLDWPLLPASSTSLPLLRAAPFSGRPPHPPLRASAGSDPRHPYGGISTRSPLWGLDRDVDGHMSHEFPAAAFAQYDADFCV
jgi:hypothetical protein